VAPDQEQDRWRRLTEWHALEKRPDSVLYGVRPHDPVTFASVVVGLLGVALIASWLPARRATRVPPAVALRAE
jgi:hypothetical protein